MKVFFYTLGCKVNQYETQAMRRLMEEEGYETAEYTPGKQMSGDAVIVVNSCTVTGESDHKLRKLLRRCRRENPQAVLVLTGCMPQAFPEQAAALTEADIVLGNAARSSLPAQVRRFLTLGQRIVDIPPHGGKFESLSIGEFQGRTRAGGGQFGEYGRSLRRTGPSTPPADRGAGRRYAPSRRPRSQTGADASPGCSGTAPRARPASCG